ncbi:MAG: hypothetical protein WC197_03505 [Candidatus Gastranaerophilaceae bacterium]
MVNAINTSYKPINSPGRGCDNLFAKYHAKNVSFGAETDSVEIKPQEVVTQEDKPQEVESNTTSVATEAASAGTEKPVKKPSGYEKAVEFGKRLASPGFSYKNAATQFWNGLISPISNLKNAAITIGGAAAIGAILTQVGQKTRNTFGKALVALGVVIGAIQIGSGVHKFVKAEDATGKENAFYDIGTGTGVAGLAILSSKSTVKNTGVNVEKMNHLQTTWECLKPGALKEYATTIVSEVNANFGKITALFGMPAVDTVATTTSISSVVDTHATAAHKAAAEAAEIAATIDPASPAGKIAAKAVITANNAAAGAATNAADAKVAVVEALSKTAQVHQVEAGAGAGDAAAAVVGGKENAVGQMVSSNGLMNVVTKAAKDAGILDDNTVAKLKEATGGINNTNTNTSTNDSDSNY